MTTDQKANGWSCGRKGGGRCTFGRTDSQIRTSRSAIGRQANGMQNIGQRLTHLPGGQSGRGGSFVAVVRRCAIF